MELSLVEQHHVVFPVLALFNTWANKSQGDSEYWRKVSSGKLHQGQGSLTLSGGTKDAHLVAPVSGSQRQLSTSIRAYVWSAWLGLSCIIWRMED